MQNFNLIAQSVLKLSHCKKVSRRQRQQRQRRRRRHPPGLNYSPRRKVFRRGQKVEEKEEEKQEEKEEEEKETYNGFYRLGL